MQVQLGRNAAGHGGSCWYYLRFIDPMNERSFCAEEAHRYFMPVDLYIGGAEHAVLHLLYSRFWHKVLFDLGHVATPEPFRRLFNQGMITADAFQDERGVYIDIREVEFRDGEPYQAGTDKSLTRTAASRTGLRVGGEAAPDLQRLLHRTIVRVTDDVENLRFNTAIAALIELNNELVALPAVPAEVARTFLLLLAPFAPHLAEEVWELGRFGSGSISSVPWPKADPHLLVREMVILPVQVNGRVRANVEVPAQIDEAALRELVFASEGVRRYVVDPAKVKRFVLVPGRIVNIVV